MISNVQLDLAINMKAALLASFFMLLLQVGHFFASQPSVRGEIKNLIRWILEVRRVTTTSTSTRRRSRRWRMWAMATALSGGRSPPPGQHNFQKEASSAQEISFHGRLELVRLSRHDGLHWWEAFFNISSFLDQIGYFYYGRWLALNR